MIHAIFSSSRSRVGNGNGLGLVFQCRGRKRLLHWAEQLAPKRTFKAQEKYPQRLDARHRPVVRGLDLYPYLQGGPVRKVP